jgi:hypothetical protein
MVTKSRPHPKAKAVAPAKAASTLAAFEAAPEWVASMHSHFCQKGFYRAEDLVRLVGDPRDSVSVSISGGTGTCHAAAKAD